MREIAEPSARAASVAGGMGGVRGGAFQEGLAREGARMALPIAQMIQQAMGEFGSAQVGVGGGLEARKAGLAGLLEQMRQGQVAERSGLANQLFGMRQTADTRTADLASRLFGMGQSDSRIGQLGLLQSGANAAAVPRLGSLQDMLRQQQLALLQRGMTSTGSLAGTGSSSATQPFTLGSLLGPASSIAAASLLAPAGSGGSQLLSSLLSSGGGGSTVGSAGTNTGFVGFDDLINNVSGAGGSGIDYSTFADIYGV